MTRGVPAPVSRVLAEAEHRARWLRSPLRPITRAYVRAYGTEVSAGPFAGLRYPRGVLSHITAAVPKLMGAYERELHQALERAIATMPETVVNAGVADGYYAVGLARRLADATVHGFDVESHWRRICSEVAVLNGVAERIRLGQRLDARALSELPLAGALVLIDCDGCEAELFDPHAREALREATVIVETHDHVVAGITDTLLSRFAATHSAQVIGAEPRWISEFPQVGSLPETTYVDRELGITEFRPYQSWLVLTPTG